MLPHALGVFLTPPFLQSSHGTLIILAIELGKQFIWNPELPNEMISSGHSASWSGSCIWQSSTCWQNTLLGRGNTLLPLHSSQMECLSYSSGSLRNCFFLFFSVILLLHLAISHLPSGDTFPFPDESWPHEASWGALCHAHCLKSPAWSHLARIIQWFEGYGPANWKNRGRCYWQKPLCFADVVVMLMMVLMEMPPPCLIFSPFSMQVS